MRRLIKQCLARTPDSGPDVGLTVLIYHRVGAGSPDERDLATADFADQLELLSDHRILTIDDAATALQSGDARPGVVLTFDDGFADVFDNAWPLLRERQIPFVLYLASRFVGATMHWDGSTARAAGPALSWDQIGEMVASGLCTIGNHTHSHLRPEVLDAEDIDLCTQTIQQRLGIRAQHFAYPWGIPVDRMDDALACRFRTAVTGELGRNVPGQDLLRLRRIPVRQTDPLRFFAAKLGGSLRAERAYGQMVSAAKRVGLHA
jgi:peptidoglycan/xylan/chitin deacetylase (PgdA/CDA1 family)